MATTRFGFLGYGVRPAGSFAGRAPAPPAATPGQKVIFRPAGRRKYYADIMFDLMTRRTLTSTFTVTLNIG